VGCGSLIISKSWADAMHIELLIEDASGAKMLEHLLPKICLGHPEMTWKIHAYKGVGKVPAKGSCNANVKTIKQRALLDNLPRLLSGYGKAFSSSGTLDQNVVIVVCDLDDKDLKSFTKELKAILAACIQKPVTHFCLAIEEGEAWLLGDVAAIKAAFPKCSTQTLRSYKQDSICGTWEKLADAVYPGGAQALSKQGYQVVGAEKFKWAETITPLMDVGANRSPSFNVFKSTVEALIPRN